MTRAEARARAEELVYVGCVYSDILRRCEQAGIPIFTSRGKLRNRPYLEDDLINYYTNRYSTESEDKK